MAQKEAEKYIQDKLSKSVADLGQDSLTSIARTSMSSKLIGSESEFFADMAAKACSYVKTASGKVPVKNIHILKSHGKSSLESTIFEGYVLQMSRVSQQMHQRLDNVKVACLDMNLSKFRLGMGTSVQIDDPKNLKKVRQREMDILKERVKYLIDAGANLILSTKAIDDMASKYLVENGAIGLRRVEKQDMRRIARLTGATMCTTFAKDDGTESFDKSMLGKLEYVYEEAVGDNDFCFLKAKKGNQSACSIMLRGANEYMLDEIDRSLHDSLCVVKRMLESNSLVPGGGAVEAALNVYLQEFALKTIDTREQLAVEAFAEALLVIPKTLAVNAAQDGPELVSKLKSIHAKSHRQENVNDNSNYKNYGLDLINGEIRDSLAAGVVEPAISKIKSLRFATEAALTILRIDDRITIMPNQQ